MTIFAPTDRDPSNQAEMKLSIIRWLDSRDREHDHDQETRDEADIALEADLLAQGVINPSETVETFKVIYWDDEACGIIVKIEAGPAIYMLRRTGEVCAVVGGDLI